LAAGFGTRLGPLTDELPKPLVPFGDSTLLELTARRLVSRGLEELVVNTHHLSDRFPPAVVNLPGRVRLSHESQILGTAGGVHQALKLLHPPVLVHNVDIVLDQPPVEELFGALGEFEACLLVRPTAGTGSVGLDPDGRVVRLRGENYGVEASSADYVGVIALGSTALASLPRAGCLVADYLMPRLRSGVPIGTRPFAGKWSDVGTLNEYLEGNLGWLEEHHGASSWCGPGAELAPGVQLQQVLVGAGARVEGTGLVERAVIWPGAVARSPIDSVIVTPRGVVPVPGS
jgi:NDP-sugar pyrophosphorylase family protein